LAFLASLLLGACRATLDVERQARPEIVAPAGSKVIETPQAEVIEPPPDKAMCEVRSRHFLGTVQVPCEDVARETSPGGLRP
jgi:hypothetical protein